MNKKFSLLLLTLALNSAYACQAKADVTPSSFDCQLLVITKEKPSFPDQNFKAPVKADSGHGGDERTFKAEGNPNEVTIIVDGKWLGLSWWKYGEVVAEALFVVTDFSQDRVAIVYNPKNRDEQVSLNCSMVK